MKNKLALMCTTLLVSTLAHGAEHRVKDNKNKLADDPTKVITKFGASHYLTNINLSKLKTQQRWLRFYFDGIN